MKFSQEDVILIKDLYLSKQYGARRVVAFLREPERKSPLGKIPHDVIMTSSYE